MKWQTTLNSFIPILILLFSSQQLADQQKPLAESCDKYCGKFAVVTEDGNYNKGRTFFKVTNKTVGAKDLQLFVEGTDDKWWSAGFKANLAHGETFTFDRFRVTGRYIIYFKDAGDEKHIYPSQDFVNERLGKKKYGYGDH